MPSKELPLLPKVSILIPARVMIGRILFVGGLASASRGTDQVSRSVAELLHSACCSMNDPRAASSASEHRVARPESSPRSPSAFIRPCNRGQTIARGLLTEPSQLRRTHPDSLRVYIPTRTQTHLQARTHIHTVHASGGLDGDAGATPLT